MTDPICGDELFIAALLASSATDHPTRPSRFTLQPTGRRTAAYTP